MGWLREGIVEKEMLPEATDVWGKAFSIREVITPKVPVEGVNIYYCFINLHGGRIRYCRRAFGLTTTTTPKSPEQIRISLRISSNHPPIRRHSVDLQHVIGRQSPITGISRMASSLDEAPSKTNSRSPGCDDSRIVSRHEISGFARLHTAA